MKRIAALSLEGFKLDPEGTGARTWLVVRAVLPSEAASVAAKVKANERLASAARSIGCSRPCRRTRPSRKYSGASPRRKGGRWQEGPRRSEGPADPTAVRRWVSRLCRPEIRSHAGNSTRGSYFLGSGFASAFTSTSGGNCVRSAISTSSAAGGAERLAGDAVVALPAAVLVLGLLQSLRHLRVPVVPVLAALEHQRLADVQEAQELLAAVGAEAGDERPRCARSWRVPPGPCRSRPRPS